MKKALSLLLASAMLSAALLLAACGGQKNPDVTTTDGTKQTTESTSAAGGETTSSGESTNTTESTSTSATDSGATVPGGSAELTGKEKHPDFMDVNFGGKTFNFAVSKGWSGGWDNYEIYAEATGSDNLITEAIINRNAVVESLYNCKIRDVKTDDPNTLLSNDVALGTSNYDFLMQLWYGVRETCMNIANLDIDFTHSWWNQDYIETMSFDYNGTKVLHSISGKFNLIMYDSIVSLFVDMDIYDRARAAGKTNIDLYQSVKDGTWTIDTMITLMEAAMTDANGDQQLTFEGGDIFGYAAHPNILAQYGFIYGAGVKTVTKDESGAYVSMSASNTDVSSVSAIIDKAASVYKSPAYGRIGELNSVKALANGQALFNVQWMIRLHSSEELINYGVDFSEKRIAVVPFPKYEESQEGYGTFISNRGYGLQVSKAIKDLNATAQFLEVFGYHSEMLLYPEYIKCIKTQCLCDDGAGEMLEIVLKSARCDYGIWNGSTGVINRIGEMVVSGKNNFAKALATTSKSCQNVLDQAMKDTYDKMN